MTESYSSLTGSNMLFPKESGRIDLGLKKRLVDASSSQFSAS